MFLELIATIVAGLAAAGMMMLVNKATGGRLPRWLTPVVAGAGMLAMTISNEYTWYSRTSGELPEGIVVAETVESRAFYRPWTYLFPYVDRFVAVDQGTVRTNDALPDQRMVDLYFFGRWSTVRKVPVVMDCAKDQRAALMGDVTFDAEGRVSGTTWNAVAPDDAVQRLGCEVT